MLVIAFLASLSSVTGVNFFIALAVCGVLNEIAFAANGMLKKSFPFFEALVAVACIAVAVSSSSSDAPAASSSVFARLTAGRGYGNLFLVGLAAGLLTFGGAYTAIPLVKQAVSGWMPSGMFFDGLALSSVVPAPLVIFNTFVGFAGHGIIGALLMTMGVFLPAFSFTLIGHEFFERAVHAERIHRFLDGVAAGVVGLVAVTAVTLIKSCVTTPQLATVYLISLGTLYKIQHRFTSIALILCSAVAGQALTWYLKNFFFSFFGFARF